MWFALVLVYVHLVWLTVSVDMVGCSSRRCKLSVQYNCYAEGHDKRDIGKGKAIPLQLWTGP
jgi:hypothetical protein